MRDTLRVALQIAGNDLRRRLRDRSFIVQAFIGPVLLAVVVSTAFSGGFGFDVKVGVVDADGSDLTTSITEALVGGAADGVAFVEVDDEADALERIESGDSIGAAVVFPAGFEASLAEATPASIGLLLDDRWVVPSAVARAVAGSVSARINAGRLAAFTLAGEGLPGPSAEVLDAVELPISVDALGAGEERSPAATVAPGMGLLFLFFTIAALARSLLEEQRLRVLDRMLAAPVSLTAVLLAKGIGVVLVGIVSMVSLWGTTSLLLGAAWGDPLGVLAISLAATFAVAGIAGLVAAVARTEQSADLLATMVAFTLGILGGSLIPLSELPEGLVRVSLFTPNGWAQQGFAELSAGGGHLGDVLHEIGVLLAWAVVGLAISARLLPRRLASR